MSITFLHNFLFFLFFKERFYWALKDVLQVVSAVKQISKNKKFLYDGKGLSPLHILL